MMRVAFTVCTLRIRVWRVVVIVLIVMFVMVMFYNMARATNTSQTTHSSAQIQSLRKTARNDC